MVAPNREAWLNRAARELIKRFSIEPKTKYRISCSWPSRRASAPTSRILGQCFNERVSADKTIEILVTMGIDDPVQVLGVLTHELCHANLGTKAGHGPAFGRLVRACLLGGKPTATEVTSEFEARVAPILRKLGPYPHARVDISKQKKQPTRMHKASCDDCGYTVRLSTKWIDIAHPACPDVDCEGHDVEMRLG